MGKRRPHQHRRGGAFGGRARRGRGRTRRVSRRRGAWFTATAASGAHHRWYLDNVIIPYRDPAQRGLNRTFNRRRRI